MDTPHPRRGFTLVELAVAMALLATLLTIGYPHMADWVARKRVQSAAEALQADLSDARLLAAQRGQSMHVGFVAGSEGAGRSRRPPSATAACTRPAA